MSYLDRGGSVERAKSDHRIKAAEAEQRSQLLGRDDARRHAGPSFLERLLTRLRGR